MKRMCQYAPDFMNCLNEVLSKGDYSTETKLHAMIAVGDICLAIEENFQDYLDETMKCLFSACQITVQPPQNFETDENINKLRDSIIEAFMSIVHGMQQVAQKGSPLEARLQNYATDILHYIDALLNKPKLETNDEFVRNIYELYIDVTEMYGNEIKGAMRQMTGPAILREGLKNFNFQGIEEIRERFMNSMNRVGCI